MADTFRTQDTPLGCLLGRIENSAIAALGLRNPGLHLLDLILNLADLTQ